MNNEQFYYDTLKRIAKGYQTPDQLRRNSERDFGCRYHEAPREITTSELAIELGVKVYVLRKWKYRGFLKLAPKGSQGVGRGQECHWSPEAVEEAKAWAALQRGPGDRRKPKRPETTP
jgi:hypothetical protein